MPQGYTMTLIDRIRAWAWLDVWLPFISAYRSRQALARIPKDQRDAGEILRRADAGHITNPSIEPAYYIGVIMHRLQYHADIEDYQQSIALLYAQMPAGIVYADCEDYAGLAGYLFAAGDVPGEIITMVRRIPGSWRTLWFDRWEGHAVWVAADGQFMADNGRIYRANSYTATMRPNYILKSWLNSGFEIVHRRETK